MYSNISEERLKEMLGRLDYDDVMELVAEVRRLREKHSFIATIAKHANRRNDEARELLEWVQTDNRDREFTHGEWEERAIRWLNNDF